MTIARAQLVDASVTRWYHCITRCVCRAFLLGEESHNRKEWIENRLQELPGIFAVSVAGFSVMDNHLHLLVRLDPDIATGWSDEEVVRRWGKLFPPRDKSREPLPVTRRLGPVALARPSVGGDSSGAPAKPELVNEMPQGTTRTTRQSPGQRPRHFFEERFKSIAILDEEALLATCAYIDLNPVAAGIAEVPEASPHTSIAARIDHVKEQGRLADLTAVPAGIVHGPNGAEVNSHGLSALGTSHHASIAGSKAASGLNWETRTRVVYLRI